MSDFSPFLRNRQSSGCNCDRSCLAHCPESVVQPRSCSFIRILARSTAFSLVQPYSRSFLYCIFQFCKQKTHYLIFCAISCSFFSLQRACVASIIVDSPSLNRFLKLRGSSAALQSAESRCIMQPNDRRRRLF